MAPFADTFKNQYKTTDTLQRLILVNALVFVILRLLNSLSALYNVPFLEFQTVSSWLAVPAYVPNLLSHPWTLLTYMFFHWDFMHILFNMLWLYWMGRIFQEYLGAKKLVSTYLIGGICGAVVYILAYNIFPLFSAELKMSYALGASASVLAITIATATLLPDYSIHLLFFGAVKLKWIAMVTILLDLINVSGDNAGGHLAHLGGALYGFLYIRQLQKGRDLGGWLNSLLELFSFRKRSKMKVSHSKRKSDEEFALSKKSRQEKLDLILDKISKSGYGSLSSEEREFLFKASKEE